MKMTSLPQGWHGMTPVPKKVPSMLKAGMPSLSHEVPTTSYKRIPDITRSKLSNHAKPAISSSSFINRNLNHCANLPVRKARFSQESQTVPSKTKSEVNTEIVNLRKEIICLKDENALLKSRIRKMDDDNNRKNRQIEKLRSAKNENTTPNIKRGEPMESISLLRQKCLRLETALKEKEIAMKKFLNGTKTITVEELKDVMAAYDKKGQNNKHNEAVSAPKTINKSISLETGRRVPVPKPAWNAAKDNTTNLEIVRLKDSVHRLQDENRRLHQQLKERDQEIKRLKLQLQRTLSSVSKNETQLSHLSQLSADNSASRGHLNTVQKSRQVSSENKAGVREANRGTKVHRLKALPQKASQTTKRMPESHKTFILTKTAQSKQLKTVFPSLPQSYCDPTLEIKVQNMRKNVAARKIQRSWRHHRQQMLEKNKKMVEKEKAVALLQSVLQGHGQRLELLELLSQADVSDIYNEEAATIRHLWTAKHYPS